MGLACPIRKLFHSTLLLKSKRLSDEYAVFTATGITKRVKLLHITAAEKKQIRLDNLHTQTNNQHESQDYRYPNMYMPLSIMPHVPVTSSKCNMPVHDCLKRSSSVTNMLCSLPQSGITKRVKLLHITAAEKKQIRLDNLHTQTNNQHESQDYRNPNMYMPVSIMPHVPVTSSKRKMPVHDCLKRSSSVTNMLCSLPRASLRELNCYTSPSRKRRSA